MTLLHQIWDLLKQFPEYWPGAVAALTLLVIALPFYLALWYFLHRRNLPFPWRLRFACLSSFVLFAGLAFIFASPLSKLIPSLAINAYLFVTCCMLAYTVVPLFDVFILGYFLIGKHKVYISPPLRKVINFTVFCLSFLPTMHYMLRFNPFALVAIPTIATAGLAWALQDSIKAFIAGIGLGRRVRVGEWVAFQDKEGRVIDIDWGRTVLRTLDGDTLYIPNNLLLTQPFLVCLPNRAHRMVLRIAVAYTAPPERVKQIIGKCVENLPGVAKFPEPVAHVLAFGDLSVAYTLSLGRGSGGPRGDPGHVGYTNLGHSAERRF